MHIESEAETYTESIVTVPDAQDWVCRHNCTFSWFERH